MQPKILESFLLIMAKMTGLDGTSSLCSGQIALTAEVISACKILGPTEILEQPLAVGSKVVYAEELSEAHQGSIAKVNLLPYYFRKHASLAYYETLDEFVVDNKCTPPSLAYFIRCLNFYSIDSPPPEKVAAYQEVQALIAFLESISDVPVTKQKEKTLHFFGKAGLDIPINYSVDDLRAIKNLSALASQFQIPETRSQHVQIFKTALEEHLRALQSDCRFSHLLQKWEQIVLTFEHSYRMYLQNFSWEKLKSEIDKEKFELLRKIAAAVSDVQTKLIAIPAAFTLVVSQLKSDQTFGLNLSILIGAFIFSVLMQVLINNQFSFLDAVEEESTQVRERLEKQYTGLTSLNAQWRPLTERIRSQECALGVVVFFNWLITFVAFLRFLALLVC